MLRFVAFIIAALTVLPAVAQTQLWVDSDTLNRRSCPSTACGVVGVLMYRELAAVVEVRDGWGRVSKYYDAACSNGVSAYVETGDSACTTANGITDGQFAEWVSMEFLVAERPADPSAGATGTAALIGASDDFRLHAAAFVAATDSLMASGRCTAADFTEIGGWTRSGSYPGRAVYFTYCGTMTRTDRLYLDATSGEVFR